MKSQTRNTICRFSSWAPPIPRTCECGCLLPTCCSSCDYFEYYHLEPQTSRLPTLTHLLQEPINKTSLVQDQGSREGSSWYSVKESAVSSITVDQQQNQNHTTFQSIISKNMLSEDDSLSPTDLFSTFNPLDSSTCWKTNLMLPQQPHLEQRSQLFRKRTSFEDNLINEHISLMFKTLISSQLSLLPQGPPLNDKQFQHMRVSKQIEDINSNMYLTEQEKWQVTSCVLKSQQNFSILMRLGSVFDQHKQQLVYIISQLLVYSPLVPPAPKHQPTQTHILSMLEEHRLGVVDRLLNQINVKLINPFFFSNVNQTPLMRIIDNWLYHILCIKQGLYGEQMNGEGEETHFQSEDEDLFER